MIKILKFLRHSTKYPVRSQVNEINLALEEGKGRGVQDTEERIQIVRECV